MSTTSVVIHRYSNAGSLAYHRDTLPSPPPVRMLLIAKLGAHLAAPATIAGDFGRCAFSKLARRRLGNGTGANPGAEPGFASPTCCRSAVGSLDLALLSLCRRTAALCAGVSHRCAGRCFALPRRLPGEPPPPPTARCQDSAVNVVGVRAWLWRPDVRGLPTDMGRWTTGLNMLSGVGDGESLDAGPPLSLLLLCRSCSLGGLSSPRRCCCCCCCE